MQLDRVQARTVGPLYEAHVERRSALPAPSKLSRPVKPVAIRTLWRDAMEVFTPREQAQFSNSPGTDTPPSLGLSRSTGSSIWRSSNGDSRRRHIGGHLTCLAVIALPICGCDALLDVASSNARTNSHLIATTISPGTAYLAPGQSLQFTATVSGTSDSLVTWSVDGVTGGNSATGSISTAGVYSAPLTEPVAGEVAITATSVADSSAVANATISFREKVYSVTSFGAIGDGVADDGPAIQNALAAAAAGGGGEVSFPCGHFALKSVAGPAPSGRSLLYLSSASGVQLQGLGECSHLYTDLPQKTVLEFDHCDHVMVSNMFISALNATYVETYGMAGGSAVRFTNVNYGTITDIEVDGASAGALYLTDATSHSTLTGNYIHDTYGGGIWEDDCGSASSTSCAPSSPPTYNTYQSNILTNTSLASTTAMALDDGGSSSYAIIEGNAFSWNRSLLPGYSEAFCIQIGDASDVSVLNNSCISAPYDGIVITSDANNRSLRSVIQGNTIQSPGSSGYGGSGICIWDTSHGDGTSGFVIAQNSVSYAAESGIEIYSAGALGGAHDGKVINNTINMVDQRNRGTTFGIDIEYSSSIAIASNTISCDGTCIAAGVNLNQSADSTPSVSANTVRDILGPPLRID